MESELTKQRLEASAENMDRESPLGPDPTQGGALLRLFRGFGLAFKGLSFMFEHPRLWSYALIPILITLVLLSLIFVLLGRYNGDLVGLIWVKPEAWVLRGLWYLLYLVVYAVAFVIGAISLPAVVSSPFLDALSERTEQIIDPSYEKLTGGLGTTLKSGLSSLLMTLGRLSFLLLGLAFLWLFGLIPVVGLVSLVLMPIWTMMWLAAENLEYAMGRHQGGFRQVFVTMRRNAMLCLGFGAGVFLFLLIPLLNLLFIPVGAVGGTMLYMRLRSAGALGLPT